MQLFSRTRKKGVVILFSLAVLAMLSILATIFATMSRLERTVSRNYVDDVRARFVAHSGVEMVVGHLQQWAARKGWDQPNDPWVYCYEPTSVLTDANRNYFDAARGGFPIELSRRPSFGPSPPAPPAIAPAPISPGPGLSWGGYLPNGRPVCGMNGQRLAATYENGADYYRLKVIDCASQLNLNLFTNMTAGSSERRTLGGMLASLGQAIRDYLLARGINVPDPVGGTANADTILAYRANRAGQRFGNEAEVNDAIRQIAGLTPQEADQRFNILRDFITVAGWIDNSQYIGVAPYSPTINFSGNTTYPLDDVGNGRGVRMEVAARPRTPVNLNGAPEPVLVAVLSGLTGYELRATATGQLVWGGPVVQWDKTLVATVDYGRARSLAQAIIARRTAGGSNAFKTWAEFEAWVRTQGFLSDAQQSVVIANCNANSRLDKFNPNDNNFCAVDKADLGYFFPGSGATPLPGGTTEFCFSSMGVFEIESLGRVSQFNGANETVLASKLLHTTVQVFQPVRLTTQADFIANRVGGNRTRTYPESLNEASVGGEPGDSDCVSWMNNPNYCNWVTTPGAKPVDRVGVWDGSFCLGTEWDPAGQASNTTFYHPFTNTFQRNPPQYLPPPEFSKDETPGGSPSAGAGLSVGRGNDLVPDGGLCWRRRQGQSDEELTFPVPGNDTIFPDGDAGLTGSVDLWLKLATPLRLGGNETGSDELIFYVVNQFYTTGGGPPQNRQQWGLGWKLERFGNRIVSTRFLYGNPDRETLQPVNRAPGVLGPAGGAWQWIGPDEPGPNDPPPAPDPNDPANWGWIPGTGAVTLALSQAEFDIGPGGFNWGPHEWHRITHRWWSGVSQELNVDGLTTVGITFPLVREQTIGLLRRINAFRLISLDRAQRFQIGGYTFNSSNNPAMPLQTVYNQGWSVGPNQTIRRYTNATIDEVRVSNNNLISGPRDRYAANGAFYTCRIPGSRLGPGRIGTVSWTTYYPQRWGTMSWGPLSPVPAPQRFRMSVAAGFAAPSLAWPTMEPNNQGTWSALPGAQTDGGGWNLWDQAAAPPANWRGLNIPVAGGVAQDLQVRFGFVNGGVTPLCVTPIVDDVTATWVHAPRYVTMLWVTRPDLE